MVVKEVFILNPIKYAGKQCCTVKCEKHKKKDRVISSMDSKYLLLSMADIRPAASDHDCCPICMEPLYEGTIHTYSCRHTVHWWCADKWRQTAGWDLCAAGAHCPECRKCTGVRLFEKRPLCLFDYCEEHIIQRRYHTMNNSGKEVNKLISNLQNECKDRSDCDANLIQLKK